MLYRGSCHCGNIAFEVEGDLTGVVACNCSICSRRGSLLWAVPHSDLRQFGSGKNIGTYTFDTEAFLHRFCRICGIHPYAEDAEVKAGRNAYVNIRCLENVDFTGVPAFEFDGRSL